MRVTTPIQVRFSDMDMAHHANNAVYLVWFELGRMDLFRRFIPKHHDWRKQGVILARNEVDHRLPVHLGDRVEIETWCSRVGTKSFELSYALFIVKESGRVLSAEGKSVMVCYDHDAGRSVAVPEAWRASLSGSKALS
jgi:acyl-CoA thioester hydrolase